MEVSKNVSLSQTLSLKHNIQVLFLPLYFLKKYIEHYSDFTSDAYDKMMTKATGMWRYSVKLKHTHKYLYTERQPKTHIYSKTTKFPYPSVKYLLNKLH